MLAWRLDAYRRLAKWAKLTATEKALLKRFAGNLEEAEEFGGVELMDVVDTASGRANHLLALWPFGSGVLVDVASKEPIADIVQHYFDAHGEQDVRAKLAAAYEDAKQRFAIQEGVDFKAGQDSPKLKARASAHDAGDRIRAMRVAIKDGSLAIRSDDAQRTLWELAAQVFDFKKYRPLPMRRLFDLSETEREMLELIWEGNEQGGELWHVGIPDTKGAFWRRNNEKLDPGDLARFLGHAPRGALDETIDVDGEPHPVWCLLHDALNGVRDTDDALELICALPIERAVAIAQGLIADASNRLRRPTPSEEDFRKGLSTPAATKEHRERRSRIANGLFDRLGAAGEAAARALVAQGASFAAEHAPLEKGPRFVRTLGWDELCIVLGVLARRAKERGAVLEPKHDETLHVIARANGTTEAIVPVLELLSPERAERIACGRLELIARFPSDDGAKAAMKLLATDVDGGSYAQNLFAKAVDALGERARHGLIDAKNVIPAKVALIDKCLAALDTAAAKSAKAKPAKTEKPTKTAKPAKQAAPKRVAPKKVAPKKK